MDQSAPVDAYALAVDVVEVAARIGDIADAEVAACCEEAGDLAYGLFDARARMIVQADTGTPGHINCLASCGTFLAEKFAGDLVPGDVLILEEGERVPADARLIDATGMRVDNAALTGESRPKRRTGDPLDDGHWLDLPNLAFAGTTILSGHGRAVVFATGMRT